MGWQCSKNCILLFSGGVGHSCTGPPEWPCLEHMYVQFCINMWPMNPARIRVGSRRLGRANERTIYIVHFFHRSCPVNTPDRKQRHKSQIVSVRIHEFRVCRPTDSPSMLVAASKQTNNTFYTNRWASQTLKNCSSTFSCGKSLAFCLP
jgi:hypothetical protein